MSSFGSIASNINAEYALGQLNQTNNQTSKLQKELSSGKAINGPAANPAGYAISQGFNTQINGTNQAISNANQAVSLLQTATGALGQQTSILQKMRTIAVQAANGTNTASDRQSLQQTVSQLQSQVSTIAQQTQFNGINLLNGSFSGVQFQVGANHGQVINSSIGNTQANNIGMNESQTVSTSGASGSMYVSSGSSSNGQDFTMSTAGNFTSGTVGVVGSQGSANITVNGKGESAANVANSVNGVTSSTGVKATANTAVNFKVTTTGSISFKLGNGTGGSQSNAVNINSNITSVSSNGLSSLVNAINKHTSQTGVTATTNSSNKLVLKNKNGKNISISSFSGTAAMKAGGTTLSTGSSGAQKATIQGVVHFQSPNGFSLTSGSNIGLQANSSLQKVSAVNVSTVTKANKAITVIDGAIQHLNQQSSALGAGQQRVQSILSNLNTAVTNEKSAQSVISDANIPKVSTQLSQQQILQQAGVAALKKSQTAQQAYLKLIG